MSRVPEAKDFTPIFDCQLQVRVSDLNYGNHVGNDRILGYLHEARVLWLANHGLSEIDVGGCGTIMAASALDYKSQAMLGQSLSIELGIGSVSGSRFTLLYRISQANGGTTVALGATDMSCFDYQRQRPVRIPNGLANLLQASTGV